MLKKYGHFAPYFLAKEKAGTCYPTVIYAPELERVRRYNFSFLFVRLHTDETPERHPSYRGELEIRAHKHKCLFGLCMFWDFLPTTDDRHKN